MSELAILTAALSPGGFLLFVFLRMDRFPEPRGVVLRTFVLGMVVVAPLVLASIFFTPVLLMLAGTPAAGAFKALFMAGVLEELAKFWVLWGYCMRHSAFDEPMDGLVYGLTASLGFACLENVMYLHAAGGEWASVAIARALLAVPSHGFNGAIMGYYAARGRFNPALRADSYRKALLIPMALHGAYDLGPLILQEVATDEGSPLAILGGLLALVAVVGIVLFEVAWTIRLFRRQRAAQIAPPPLPEIPWTPPVA